MNHRRAGGCDGKAGGVTSGKDRLQGEVSVFQNGLFGALRDVAVAVNTEFDFVLTKASNLNRFGWIRTI